MASTATRFSIPVRTAVAPAVRNVRRHITPEAGHALEKLGHAIEYLTDEIMHRGDRMTNDSPDVQAVQILMALNRSVFQDCPAVPTFADRWHSLLHRLGI